MTADNLRYTSQVRDFPYGWPGGQVLYFTVSRNVVIPMRYRDDLRQALAQDNPTIYAAWPGQYRTDLFLVDDVNALARSVGIPA